MKSIKYFALCLFSFFALNSFALYEVKQITFLDINATINPAIHNFIESNLDKLSKQNGDFVVIKLNTPGGLVSTTKDIINVIGRANFPVAVWVTPEGGSATSAGAIIASSAHILVMSEGTNIGAATPITMSEDLKKDAKSKAVNDLNALVRSLSVARGRNPAPFEQMISEAKSFDARDALKKNIIDGIINYEIDFPKFLNNKNIFIKGEKIELSVPLNIPLKTVEMDIGQQFLNIFANPSTAYILFIIGAALIYFELQAPGGFIAGSIGAISLILASIGFQVLPLNIGAGGLILLSFVLFILEVYITSFGILTIAGLASLLAGSLFLFRTENSLIELEISLILSVVGSISVYVLFLTFFLFKTWNRKSKKKIQTSFIFKVLDPETNLYQIKINGEIWKAQAQEPLKIGEKVTILNKNKLIFNIEKSKGE